MSTLREEYEDFKRKVEDKYRKVSVIVDYNFAENIIKEFDEDYRDSIKILLEEENFEDLEEYDFKERLTHTFFNNRHGEEIPCYLLSTDKSGALYILNAESNTASFIQFYNLNGVFEQIKVIETIEEFK
jgi:hypothetical protein